MTPSPKVSELARRTATTQDGTPETQELYAEVQALGLTDAVADELMRLSEAALREAEALKREWRDRRVRLVGRDATLGSDA